MTKAIKIGTSQRGNNPMTDIQNRMIRLEGNVQQIQVEIAKVNTRLDTELPHLATKADLRELEGKINTGFQEFEGKINTRFQEFEGKLNTGLQKADGNLNTVEERLNTKFQEFDGKINTRFQELEGKINTTQEKLRAEIAKSRNNIVVWLIGVAIATGLINWYGSLPYLHLSPSTALIQNKVS